ncbi:MAG: hypothetical protein CMH85_15545 [Novosphingobium sp.]|nr:hypothetical protein [Novosphingobium sp.]
MKGISTKSEAQAALDAGLCIGCGLCASMMAEEIGSMQLDDTGFLVPPSLEDNLDAAALRLIDEVCPAVNGSEVFAEGNNRSADPAAPESDYLWGSYYSVMTGYATEDAVRFMGSSGGAITALARWLIASGQADEVLVTTYDATYPIGTTSGTTHDPKEILTGAGSKYAPAAPLAALRGLANMNRRVAIVARPCDISTLRRAMSQDSAISKNIVALISFFCAGTPSDQGNRTLLEKLGAGKPENVTQFRHRGHGWPGDTLAVTRDGGEHRCTYNESWGKTLNKTLHQRCKICPDGIGELADIVAADAWYGDEEGYPSFTEADGRSLIIARTALGQKLFQHALDEGVLAAEPVPVRHIDAMQPGQLRRRRHLRMRALTLRALGIRTPTYNWSALRHYERGVSLRDRAEAVGGTLRRYWKKRRQSRSAKTPK